MPQNEIFIQAFPHFDEATNDFPKLNQGRVTTYRFFKPLFKLASEWVIVSCGLGISWPGLFT